MDGKKSHNRIELTLEEIYHEKLMRCVLENIQNTSLVLKGGTGLYMCYGLNRFSEDLDFDSDKRVEIHRDIEKSIPSDIILDTINLKKDTEMAKRYLIHYLIKEKPQEKHFLKIDISYKTPPFQNEIKVINNIKVVSIACMINNKLHTAFDGPHTRTKARDLFDLHFLAKNYTEHFTPDFAKRLMEFSKDLDQVYNTYYPHVREDTILNKIMDLETIVLELNTIATALHNKYSQIFPTQQTPQHKEPPTPSKGRRR
ncbi:nucleotidyl transferase AbiEii/AbiGii toxin family protein [Helicobacter suis]|uniref:nucleotidyl transferase AbiEii/AbiGii toxin family protein n=1 Tax=Helicobacter suis TaxID=104628 RepID=UPI0013CFF662|nr:nucleotidyl transferase AbiEii/AbiGii toxin family protein [Helicobacter suis]